MTEDPNAEAVILDNTAADLPAIQQTTTSSNDNNNDTEDEVLPHPGFYPVVLRCLHQKHPIRAWCLRAITWPWFEQISMAVILVNCLSLAMYQPCVDEDCVQPKCRILEACDHVVFTFFAWEMAVKIIAMGIYGKLAYLGDSWNRLDAFIVFAGLFEYIQTILSFLEYLPQTKDLSLTAIRTIRVLRPLRAINRIPSMRILVMLLLDTLPMLSNVLLLCFFVFFIFGIIGVQLWKGLLRHRCFLDLNNTEYQHPGVNLTEYYQFNTSQENFVAAKSYICAPEGSNGMQSCNDIKPMVMWLDHTSYITCNRSAEYNSSNMATEDSCVNWNQYYKRCIPGVHNPYMGSINFDNIGYAWVAIFQVISLESWVDIMYYIQDAHSFWDWTYFVSLIVIGSFFMINLCLVVIATQFSETKKREVEKMIQERRRYHSTSTLTSATENGSCYNQIIKLIIRQIRKLYKKIKAQISTIRGNKSNNNNTGKKNKIKKTTKIEKVAIDSFENFKSKLRNNTFGTGMFVKDSSTSLPPRASPEISDIDVVNSPRRPPFLSNSILDKSRRQSNQSCDDWKFANALTIPQTEPSSRRSSWNSSGSQYAYLAMVGMEDDDLFPVGFPSGSPVERVIDYTACTELESDTEENSDYNDEDSKKVRQSKPGIFKRVCGYIKLLVQHRFFQRGILGAILVNTLSMGIEYHNQPETLTDIIEYSNIVFCVIFALEMTLKILGEGLIVYISSGFNVFDASIVILSIVEILQGGNSGLSVLRTFRLLRILKLVRFLPALRQQLFVMLKTMDNVATFCALLVLFIFIFSVLGMTLFGGKFCWHVDGSTCTCAERADPNSDCQCDRANFDTIMWSLVTVFQILTQEDWNTVLYNGMARSSYLASLYFIALMTFGNYVLFNLLVAILVEGFSSERKYYIMEKYKFKKNTNKGERFGNSWQDSDSSCRSSESTENNSQQASNLNKKKQPKKNVGKELEIQITDTVAGNLNPPIITHTAATPMPTPQGSPANEIAIKNDKGRQLTIGNSFNYSSSTIDSIDRSIPLTDKSSPVKQSTNSNKSFMRANCCNDMESGQNYSGCNGHATRHSLDFTAENGGRIFKPVSHGSLRSSFSSNKSQSRQSSFRSHRTITPQNSIQEKHEMHLIETEIEKPKSGLSDEDEEIHCSCSILTKLIPQRQGCFKTRKDYGFYILSPNNKIRQLCQHIISQKWFDYSILFFIALNCITLAMERPSIPPKSAERAFLSISNYIFTIIFTVEMVVKVIAKGLLIGEHTYLRSGWNIMDGFLVIVSLVDILIVIAVGSSSRIFGILRVFRLLRTLRPLRVISRAPGLKLVVQTLLSSLRPIGNIVLICCTFFIIFGILGVQLFKGKLYYCDGPDTGHVTNKTECKQDPRNQWTNQKYNFDDLGQALMTLFVLSSKDGWVQIMYTGIDAVGINQQPKQNHNEWLIVYFISFLLLVGFFVLNMFVGVVVENFHKCRASQEKEEKARRAAKRARRMEKKRKRIREVPYWASYSKWRKVIHTFVDNKYFDLVIATIIGLNVITMAMEFYLMPEELSIVLKTTNYFFTCVFVIEAVCKSFALGFKRYLKDRWNQLDVLIVLLSIAGIILEEMEAKVIPINPTIIRVMRVLRIARVLKLLKMAKGIRALLDTVIQALPQVGNLGLLFFLLFFIFAALGVELFGRLECSLDNPCVGLGTHAHFENFGMAFLTLFRIATGDNWNGIMKDTLREKCDPTDNCVKNCCVSHVITPIYFVIFVLMAQFVLVNVVVAVLMKHLEESHKMMSDDDELEKEIKREIEEETREKLRQKNRRKLDNTQSSSSSSSEDDDENDLQNCSGFDTVDADGKNAEVSKEEIPASTKANFLRVT